MDTREIIVLLSWMIIYNRHQIPRQIQRRRRIIDTYSLTGFAARTLPLTITNNWFFTARLGHEFHDQNFDIPIYPCYGHRFSAESFTNYYVYKITTPSQIPESYPTKVLTKIPLGVGEGAAF